MRYFGFILTFLTLPYLAQAKLPDITPAQTTEKISEIMKAHATYKELSPLLIKRILSNYLEELDPTKSYFIEPDIQQWLEPNDALVQKILDEFHQSNFSTFAEINKAMGVVIQRHRDIEKHIDLSNLPKKVKAQEFKDMKWVKTVPELTERITRLMALQIESASKLNEELKEKSLQRIEKRQTKLEDDILNTDPRFREQTILSDVLKATASALDTHTYYFTPDEATQFLINVQQRLFGIGAQLRDDINGFTVTKIIEGSPADLSKNIKLKDRIIAVNGEPVVGMDITDAVELIRGEKGTLVNLTVIRETTDENGEKKEEKLEFPIPRGEVVLKESRYESRFVAYGDGGIAYLKLYTFYQDESSSSTEDLTRELEKLKKDHNVKGVVLDLRYNAGGLLSQAVGVAGMFITKGIVASIKDDDGNIQHLRDTDGKMVWEGPLIVLVNRGSASASEIVAQSLQDYGRALIVGDDHTFGKGSFQTFTLNATKNDAVNPQGEYKVTRGRYYTVSGKTPQLTGVISDVDVPGLLSESEIGEQYAKFPLENDHIKESFQDDLADIPFWQRDKVRTLYKFDLQPRLTTYQPYIERLKANSSERIASSKFYQEFLKEIKKKDKDISEEEGSQEQLKDSDFQLEETYNVMRDLLFFMNEKSASRSL